MEPEKTTSIIWIIKEVVSRKVPLSWGDLTRPPWYTHDPCIAPTSVDEPSCDLSCGLYDEQAAEALEQLEDGAGVAQALIPAAQGDVFQQAALTKEPLVPALVVVHGWTEVAQSARDPVGGAGVDGEAVEGPDQQGGQNDPLGHAQEVGQRPAHAGPGGRDGLGEAVEEVEEEDGQAVGEARVAAAHIEGYRYGEDDGQQVDCAGHDVEDGPHGRVRGLGAAARGGPR